MAYGFKLGTMTALADKPAKILCHIDDGEHSPLDYSLNLYYDGDTPYWADSEAPYSEILLSANGDLSVIFFSESEVGAEMAIILNTPEIPTSAFAHASEIANGKIIRVYFDSSTIADGKCDGYKDVNLSEIFSDGDFSPDITIDRFIAIDEHENLYYAFWRGEHSIAISFIDFNSVTTSLVEISLASTPPE